MILDDPSVKHVAVLVLLVSAGLFSGCSTRSTDGAAPPSAAAPSPLASVCAKVRDDEVAKAFGVTGWHGQDLRQPGHDPSDVRCEFRGQGYQFEVRTIVVPGAVASADDALRVLLGVLPGQPIDGERVDGVGDAAVYSTDEQPLLLMGLSAVKRAGGGWRSLQVAGSLTPAGSDQLVRLPKGAIVALAQKIMARL